jgi:hypothetical protein
VNIPHGKTDLKSLRKGIGFASCLCGDIGYNYCQMSAIIHHNIIETAFFVNEDGIVFRRNLQDDISG